MISMGGLENYNYFDTNIKYSRNKFIDISSSYKFIDISSSLKSSLQIK